MKTRFHIFIPIFGFLLFFSEKSIAQEEAKTFCPNMTPFIASFGTYTICNGYNLILYTNQGSGLSYQWLLNGKPINGANSNLYYASVPGRYSVWVTKFGCVNISNEIEVTTGSYPSLQLPTFTDTLITKGDSVELAVKGGTNWQWFKNYIPIKGATHATYFAKDSGYYHVEAANGGCVRASSLIKVDVKERPHLSFSSMDWNLAPNDTLIFEVKDPGLYQWYKNQQPIPGETKNILKVFSAGRYAVEVEFGKDKTMSLEIEVTEKAVLGTLPTIQNKNFIVRTNPFTYNTIIEFTNGFSPEEISITNLQGEIIFSLTGNETQKELTWGENISKGIYLLYLKKEDRFEVVKLVKN